MASRRTPLAWLAPLALAAAAAASYLALVARVARLVLLPEPTRDVVRVLAVDRAGGTVSLTADPDTTVPGRYGLWFADDTGYARVGALVRREGDSVVRELVEEVMGELSAGVAGRLSGWYHLGPDDVPVDAEDVIVETPLGPAPAWLTRGGSEELWAVHVHGRGARRAECLRALPVFGEAGITSLVVSYRNDPEAPPSRDGRYGLGATEWRDIEAALRFARARGARRVVLVGWSMGGAIALQVLARSSLARELVVGLVLDSPVIDWRSTLRFQAARRRIPAAVAAPALRLVQASWAGLVTGQAQALELDSLDFVTRAGELSRPALILHSDGDDFVPPEASRRLARARPDLVTLVEYADARHTRLWNVDSERWERAVGDWLDRHVLQAARSRT